MLDFNTNLSNALDKDSTESYWYLKLYYGDETNFTGVSDKDRTVGSDIYYGVVIDWGSFTYSLSVENFIATQNAWTVKIANTDKSVNGSRFSDLLSSNYYESRKWELYQSSGSLSSSDSEILGSGIISGDFSYNANSLTIRLQPFSAKHNLEVPTSKVTQTTFPNAPEKNRNIPLPCLYGDFSVDTTFPTPLDQYVAQTKVPAVIVDEFNETDNKVEARVDSVAVDTLYTKNVYHYKNGMYSACENSNVTVNNTTASIKFSGNTFYAFKELTGAQAAVDRTP